MAEDYGARRAAFRALHQQGCFVLPNPWDVGSARRLQAHGFAALASTSSGAAWALGLNDGELSLTEVLDHLRMLVAATDLPVNADFEAGFADAPKHLAANVALCVETGVAGLSIEDRIGSMLYDLSLGIERIRAARESIDATGQDVMLVGRSEGFLVGHTNLEATIVRLGAYAEAGADCLFAPGVKDLDAIAELVKAVAPKPLNVLLSGPGLSVAELAGVGVRRVSVGGSLAAAAWRGFEAATQMLMQEGRMPPRG